MDQIMAGAVAMGFSVAGLFFLRFWWETRDRLFAYFTLSFFLMAVNRVGLGLSAQPGGTDDNLHWVRFLAFVLIIVGIIDKNLSRKSTAGPGVPQRAGEAYDR